VDYDDRHDARGRRAFLVAVVVLLVNTTLPVLLLRTPRTAPAEALGLVPEGTL